MNWIAVLERHFDHVTAILLLSTSNECDAHCDVADDRRLKLDGLCKVFWVRMNG